MVIPGLHPLQIQGNGRGGKKRDARRLISPARGVPRPISRAMMNLRHGRTVLAGTLGGAIRILQRNWSEYEGMELLIGEFYASLREKRPPPVTAEVGGH